MKENGIDFYSLKRELYNHWLQQQYEREAVKLPAPYIKLIVCEMAYRCVEDIMGDADFKFTQDEIEDWFDGILDQNPKIIEAAKKLIKSKIEEQLSSRDH